MEKSANKNNADPFTTASAQARINHVEAEVDEALQSGIEAGNDIVTNALFGIAPDGEKMEQMAQAITLVVEGLKDAKKIKKRLAKKS